MNPKTYKEVCWFVVLSILVTMAVVFVMALGGCSPCSEYTSHTTHESYYTGEQVRVHTMAEGEQP